MTDKEFDKQNEELNLRIEKLIEKAKRAKAAATRARKINTRRLLEARKLRHGGKRP